jgi:signal transduction histidine kinase
VHPEDRNRATLAGAHALLATTLAFIGALCGAPVHAAPPDGPAHHVVTVSATDPNLPAFVILDNALQREVRARAERRTEFYAEALDMLRFPAARFEREALALLRAKYRDFKVDVVVAIEASALKFVEQHREQVWPGAAIVFHSVSVSELRGRALGARTAGVPVRDETAIEATLDLALVLRPQTRRVVVVSGTAEFDRRLEELSRAALARLAGRLQADYLVDEPLAEMLAAVRNVPADTILLYLSVFRDGAGAPQVPRDVLARIAAASPVPVFGIFDTQLGSGITAGVIATFEVQGRRAGELVARILNGERPGDIGVQLPITPGCTADWRQLNRWGIDESLLPDGCEVRFREPSLWREYRLYMIGAVALFALQALMIGSLLLQRARRRRAELAVQQQRTELAHAGRLATMGELTATIAHEVNQPLAAILSNVDAAELLLESGRARLEDVRQILADVRKDDLRASEVIRRLRALLARHEMARERLDLNEAITEVLKVLGAEAGRRQVVLAAELDPALPRVLGDRVHLQQVVLNLAVNAMDAMADTHVSRRRVAVCTAARQDGSVEVAVTDFGHGISRENLAKLFESFFTTKQRGMGLGLSIARSIVQAHGGLIWAESDPGGGATFRFTLPGAKPAAVVPTLPSQPAHRPQAQRG